VVCCGIAVPPFCAGRPPGGCGYPRGYTAFLLFPHFLVIPLREKVERFFNKLKQFRRIATRYEKLRHTFLAFMHIVALWIMLR
jgi:transposase